MAFPTTGILDNFNRTDDPTPIAGWTNIVNGFALVSNQAIGTAAAANVSYWNATTFGPNVEAYATIPTKPLATFLVGVVYLNASTLNGYGVVLITGAGTDAVNVNRYDGGAPTVIATAAQEVAAGEMIGYERIGNNHQAWYYNGSVWAQIATASSSIYAETVNIMMISDNLTAVLDDFGGGTVVAGRASKNVHPWTLGVNLGLGLGFPGGSVAPVRHSPQRLMRDFRHQLQRAA